jgi:hypothetical protein
MHQALEIARRALVRRSLTAAVAFGLVIATLGAAAAATVNDGENEGAKLGPGCAPDRPAIAHHAGGVLVKNPRDRFHTPPIPCTTNTGFRTGEISIVVSNKGTVLLQPALMAGTSVPPIGVLRSTDQGASWSFIYPGGSPPRDLDIDMNMWVDPDTGRVFWTTWDPLRVDHSDDDGISWIPSAMVPLNADHTQIFSGPPIERLKTSTRNYPNVVYLIVAGGGDCGSGGTCGAHITKSLDGGQTWDPGVALKYPPECPSPGANPAGAYGLRGVVGKDGTVYVPLTPCQRPYVAISNDGGETWQLSLVADTQTIGWGELGLGVDKDGNLYAAWTGAADRLPYLAISRDHGAHWSPRKMIGAPGVNEAAEPVLVAGTRGQVAVTYYGSKNSPGVPFPALCLAGTQDFGPPSIYSLETASLSCPPYASETWSTYITESFNALDDEPLFWSATLNKPDQPTWYGMTPSAMRVPGQSFAIGSDALEPVGIEVPGHTDYYGMTMDADGTPWVGFFQECPFGLPVSGNPNCPSTLVGAPTDGLFALVGRLIHVKGANE